MNVRLRWALVALVLVLAAAIALWPRTPDSARDTNPAVADALAAVRTQAKLSACPPARGGVSETFHGVSASCLGNGAAVDMGAITAGRITLLNVWATWCTECRDELPLLQSYARQRGAATVLTLQTLSPQADGLELLHTLGVHLPTVYDQGTQPQRPGAVGEALQLPQGLPATYVINSAGRAQLVTKPRVFTSVEQIARVVRDQP